MSSVKRHDCTPPGGAADDYLKLTAGCRVPYLSRISNVGFHNAFVQGIFINGKMVADEPVCEPKQFWERRKIMKRVPATAAIVVTIVTVLAWATSVAESGKKEIIGLTADQVRWFTPPYYNDGRQRAHLFGDSGQDGAWIDRVKIPGDARVLAHTHPQDELVTVIEGTWYLGEGAKFDAAKLKSYPAGSFIVIPAGVPHFVATKEGTVVIQLSGTEKFQTKYLEK